MATDAVELTGVDVGFRSIVVIFHRPEQAPPATLNGRPLVHFSFDGDPLDAVLGLVAPLVMPLVYRSVICVALEDFEYLFARGGRLRCLRETRSENLDVCLAELACQLGGTKKPAGGYKRLLMSMLLPSPLPAVSVVDRVLEVVGRYNASAETTWLISTLVHQECALDERVAHCGTLDHRHRLAAQRIRKLRPCPALSFQLRGLDETTQNRRGALVEVSILASGCNATDGSREFVNERGTIHVARAVPEVAAPIPRSQKYRGTRIKMRRRKVSFRVMENHPIAAV